MTRCGRIAGALCVALAASGGCGESREFAPVSGTVYYNGKPVDSGVVMFQPAAGEMARGTIRADGTYTLETLGKSSGVAPGSCKVRVSVRSAAPNTGGEVGLGKLLIPEVYSDFDRSGLVFDVRPDRQEPYDIRLED